MDTTQQNDKDVKIRNFARALYKVIDEKYKPSYIVKIKIDNNNINKQLKQKCAAHPYNVLGWVLTTFEKAMVGKRNWKTDHIPFLWIKVAEKEGKYQHGYVVLSNVNSMSGKIQGAIDRTRDELLGTIEMNMIRVNSVADLEIDPSIIAYKDAEGNPKLRNIIPSKTILGI
ncbi:MAG: hypothetical protein J6039_04300 [Alphaproteobacteria bacterium]|nr:hypothetical protein [Alphaproteobacteria bacterium]